MHADANVEARGCDCKKSLPVNCVVEEFSDVKIQVGQKYST